MKTGYKVALYTATLAVVFGATWAAGAAAGPPEPPAAHSEKTTHAEEPTHGGHETTQAEIPPGLSVSDNGYTLRLTENKSLAFHVEGPDGQPVTKFEVEHEKRLHLVVVRRDGSNFQHVHPEMASDGTWSIPLSLPEAGSYRVFADFTPEGGPKTTLGADVHTPGDYRPKTYADSRTFTADGYEVSLAGELTPGKASTVTLEISKNGEPVTDLQNYLGAKGHLVALRASDLAYLHVHPEDSDQVKFAVEVPTAGRYRLFLDFQHEDQVRTAEFTLTTHEEGGHGH
ncbi:hypothetical protein [Lentzea flaviverrucosa]|uniref:Heavy-metal-associated domain-containing protein n=1 Tax=Lentzea flaviverrucosa TaxID=200379 RepID=A0A1H9JJC2_9PSEU|nr:hypothetical protein [Lentzea flaviverrucosa]RDI26531.1 hypothetical protein DFR72_107172 [Lentzea flaviverrucosa]SEQ86920.1 hypothetical protein SAMN05216195_103265 [Lentzea flaviverrucosa]